jgi:hypothetical protein
VGYSGLGVGRGLWINIKISAINTFRSLALNIFPCQLRKKSDFFKDSFFKKVLFFYDFSRNSLHHGKISLAPVLILKTLGR